MGACARACRPLRIAHALILRASRQPLSVMRATLESAGDCVKATVLSEASGRTFWNHLHLLITALDLNCRLLVRAASAPPPPPLTPETPVPTPGPLSTGTATANPNAAGPSNGHTDIAGSSAPQLSNARAQQGSSAQLRNGAPDATVPESAARDSDGNAPTPADTPSQQHQQQQPSNTPSTDTPPQQPLQHQQAQQRQQPQSQPPQQQQQQEQQQQKVQAQRQPEWARLPHLADADTRLQLRRGVDSFITPLREEVARSLRDNALAKALMSTRLDMGAKTLRNLMPERVQVPPLDDPNVASVG